MNIKDYISSGILEEYALGNLSNEEVEKVEDIVLQYPEIREELTRIEETIEEVARRTAIPPRPELRNKILQSVKTDSEQTVVSSINISRWKYAAAASVVLAAISITAAIFYYTKWQQTDEQLSRLITQNQQMAEDYFKVNEERDRLISDYDIINNPKFERILLAGTEAAPDANVSVFWNRGTEELYLQINQLAELSDNNQYQLWAIIDGIPVDAGVFDLSTYLIAVNRVQNADAFAITIEPTGGSASPTLSTMQVYGTPSG